MMSEDITRKKLTTGMSWVQRFFPRKTGVIIVVVEVEARGDQPQVSYTSGMPREATVLVLKDLLPRLDADG